MQDYEDAIMVETAARIRADCIVTRNLNCLLYTSGLTAEPDSALMAQLTTDLQNMADYLEQLDASVVQNREELLNLTGSQNETYSTIQE